MKSRFKHFIIGLSTTLQDGASRRRKLQTVLVTVEPHVTIAQLLRQYAPVLMKDGLPKDILVRGLNGNLEVTSKISEIHKQLRVADAALTLEVVWPVADFDLSTIAVAKFSKDEAHKPVGKGISLAKLRPSSRYTSIDASAEQFHRSRTRPLKEYILKGAFKETHLAEAMRTPNVCDRVDIEYIQVELVKFQNGSDKRSVTLQLSGPKDRVNAFLAAGNETVPREWQPRLAPILIPSLKRPETATLNWSADHFLGGENVTSVVIVLEPCDVASYRARWPEAVFMILPRDNQAIVYSFYTHKNINSNYQR